MDIEAYKHYFQKDLMEIPLESRDKFKDLEKARLEKELNKDIDLQQRALRGKYFYNITGADYLRVKEAWEGNSEKIIILPNGEKRGTTGYLQGNKPVVGILVNDPCHVLYYMDLVRMQIDYIDSIDYGVNINATLLAIFIYYTEHKAQGRGFFKKYIEDNNYKISYNHVYNIFCEINNARNERYKALNRYADKIRSMLTGNNKALSKFTDELNLAQIK